MLRAHLNFFFCTIVLIAANTSAATIYLCTAPNGSKSFQDRPCPKASNTHIHSTSKAHSHPVNDVTNVKHTSLKEMTLVTEMYAMSEVLNIAEQACPTGLFTSSYKAFKAKHEEQIQLGKYYYENVHPELKATSSDLADARKQLAKQVETERYNFSVYKELKQHCYKRHLKIQQFNAKHKLP